jgi:hypothetical protein
MSDTIPSGRIDVSGWADPVRSWLGVPPGARRFQCPIPGHDGLADLGVPPDDPAQELRLICCSGRWRSLGEMTAARAYGKDERLKNVQIAVWTRRLGYELEILKPIEIQLPRLTPDFPPSAEVARKGFGEHIGLRWADGPRIPVPYSLRFVMAWNRLSFYEARVGLKEILRQEIIVRAGTDGRCPVYLPGPGSDRDKALSEEELIERLRRDFDAEEIFEEPEDG